MHLTAPSHWSRSVGTGGRDASERVGAITGMRMHPIGAAALAIAGPSGAAVFAVLYGAGNGLLTIARGTVPLVIFGSHAYGERTGMLGVPARAAQAFAPLIFGLLLDTMGTSVILVSAGLCLAALGALLCLRASSINRSPRARGLRWSRRAAVRRGCGWCGNCGPRR